MQSLPFIPSRYAVFSYVSEVHDYGTISCLVEFHHYHNFLKNNLKDCEEVNEHVISLKIYFLQLIFLLFGSQAETICLFA
jgi:hypothetical protein